MDAPRGKAPMQAGPPPIIMAGGHEPLKEQAQHTSRRRLELATVFVLLAVAVVVVAALR